jgi:Tat protein translocase TatB subunit
MKVFMGFIGTQELLMILVVAIVVVGPKRLPELARGLGQSVRNFRRASAQVRAELNASGALDEINQFKDSIRGVASDLQAEVTELTAVRDSRKPEELLNLAPLPDAQNLPAENQASDPPSTGIPEKK